MPQDFAWLIITALAGTVTTLALTIFKILTDRNKDLQEQNDKLLAANTALQSQNAEQVHVNAGQKELMERIMTIVEDIRDGARQGGESTRRIGPTRRG